MKSVSNGSTSSTIGRSPQGERGLKYWKEVGNKPMILSLSARRAWIEMSAACCPGAGKCRRSPQGERGLKFAGSGCALSAPGSLSARRAWIEITLTVRNVRGEESLSARRAWIEIKADYNYESRKRRSLSARRAWIEIKGPPPVLCCNYRRSPQGERGLKYHWWVHLPRLVLVALRKESVD